MKDTNRKVKIDYSVLEEFLNYFVRYDGVVDVTYGYEGFTESMVWFDEKLKKKAKNILENS